MIFALLSAFALATSASDNCVPILWNGADYYGMLMTDSAGTGAAGSGDSTLVHFVFQPNGLVLINGHDDVEETMLGKGHYYHIKDRLYGVKGITLGLQNMIAVHCELDFDCDGPLKAKMVCEMRSPTEYASNGHEKIRNSVSAPAGKTDTCIHTKNLFDIDNSGFSTGKAAKMPTIWYAQRAYGHVYYGDVKTFDSESFARDGDLIESYEHIKHEHQQNVDTPCVFTK